MTELDANESLPTSLEHSAIVIAHPDDEVLWFCSVLHEVDRGTCPLPNDLYSQSLG